MRLGETIPVPKNSAHRMPTRLFCLVATLGLILSSTATHAQDWIRTGTGLGVEKVRLAAADFKQNTNDDKNAALLKVFNETLFNDLDNAGIFDMVSKTMAPQSTPGSPQEISLNQWSAAPANAEMVAFGALSSTNGRVARSVVCSFVPNRPQARPNLRKRAAESIPGKELFRDLFVIVQPAKNEGGCGSA